MNIRAALQYATNRISNSASPQLDALVLLAFALRTTKEFLFAHPEYQLRLHEQLRFLILVKRRAKGCPVAYIVKNKEFFKRKFFVNRHVLIPRPDTELVIDLISEVIPPSWTGTILDIGTGSGCIAITCALEFPACKVLATDVSKSALRVARKNINTLFAHNVTLCQGNLLLPIEKYYTKHALLDKSILIANLPYLPNDELQGDVRFEPRLALQGGNDGLNLYRKLITQIRVLPVRPDYIFFEIDPRHEKILNQEKYSLKNYETSCRQDLSGQSRYFIYKKLQSFDQGL